VFAGYYLLEAAGMNPDNSKGSAAMNIVIIIGIVVFLFVRYASKNKKDGW
jgi:hypothetical protein